jgi:hypothetical protein
LWNLLREGTSHEDKHVLVGCWFAWLVVWLVVGLPPCKETRHAKLDVVVDAAVKKTTRTADSKQILQHSLLQHILLQHALLQHAHDSMSNTHKLA